MLDFHSFCEDCFLSPKIFESFDIFEIDVGDVVKNLQEASKLIIMQGAVLNVEFFYSLVGEILMRFLLGEINSLEAYQT